MSYRIKWSPQSLSELRTLQKDISKRIIKKINQAKENPKYFLKSLTNMPGKKLRIGDYRAIIDLLEKEKILAVRIIKHRKNIYK